MDIKIKKEVKKRGSSRTELLKALYDPYLNFIISKSLGDILREEDVDCITTLKSPELVPLMLLHSQVFKYPRKLKAKNVEELTEDDYSIILELRGDDLRNKDLLVIPKNTKTNLLAISGTRKAENRIRKVVPVHTLAPEDNRDGDKMS